MTIIHRSLINCHTLQEVVRRVNNKYIFYHFALTIICPNGPIFMIFWNCSYMSLKLNTPKIEENKSLRDGMAVQLSDKYGHTVHHQ